MLKVFNGEIWIFFDLFYTFCVKSVVEHSLELGIFVLSTVFFIVMLSRLLDLLALLEELLEALGEIIIGLILALLLSLYWEEIEEGFVDLWAIILFLLIAFLGLWLAVKIFALFIWHLTDLERKELRKKERYYQRSDHIPRSYSLERVFLDPFLKKKGSG